MIYLYILIYAFFGLITLAVIERANQIRKYDEFSHEFKTMIFILWPLSLLIIIAEIIYRKVRGF